MCRAPGLRRAILALVIAMAFLAVPPSARSQDDSKVAPPLLDLVFYVEEQQARAGKRSEIPLPRGIAIDSNGRVPVVITVTEMTGASFEELRVLSAVVQTHDARSGLVQAFIPLRRVKELAKRPWVRGIRLPSYGG